MCQTATCSDGVRNGDETDVDCGGTVCPGCANGGSCQSDGDCKSGVCNSGTCAECRNGETRSTADACGYSDRGTLNESCNNGSWTRDSCTDVWFRNCREIKSAKSNPSSGRYTIDPDKPGGESPFPVQCNMDHGKGGWTRLNLRSDAHQGSRGLPFGRQSHGSGSKWASSSEFNWGQGPGFFQKPGNNHCTVYAIGASTGSTYRGKPTLWDYYDADGNPIPPAQIEALSGTLTDGTRYDGKFYVDDPDGPFPNGGDGDGGTNSFSIAIDTSATHTPTGGGPLVLWFSTDPDMDSGTTHAIGSDYDHSVVKTYEVNWKLVHDGGVPRFMGGKVDKNENLYSTFTNGCDAESNGMFEWENPFVFAR
jgi:hypothetical protein